LVTLLAYVIAYLFAFKPIAFLATAALLLGLEYSAFAVFLIVMSKRGRTTAMIVPSGA
jgi:hypothetical protein